MKKGEFIAKSLSLQGKTVNEDDRTVTFVASDSSRDSDGWRIPVENWVLDRFKANPNIGYQHSQYWSTDPDDVIGYGDVDIEDGKLMVTIHFEPKDINELADKVYRKIRFGSINAVSVGFLPLTDGDVVEEKDADGNTIYTYVPGKVELCEISVVNIPSNANATRTKTFRLMQSGDKLTTEAVTFDELRALKKSDESEAAESGGVASAAADATEADASTEGAKAAEDKSLEFERKKMLDIYECGKELNN
jgi:hypothetical protein